MSTDPYGSPRVWYRRPAFVIAAAFLAVVLVAGLAVTLWPRSSDPDPSPSPTNTGTTQEPTSTTTPSSPADPEASICGLDPGPQEVPSTPPADAQWDLFGTFAAPSVEGVGPGLTDEDGLRHCFAHSPTGALLAAINVIAMGQVEAIWGVDDRIVADTPARDRLQEELSSASPTVTPNRIQMAAYSLDVRGSDDVVVTVVFEREDGALFSMPYPVVWEAGDWKFVLPDVSDTYPVTAHADLSGFTEWSGA